MAMAGRFLGELHPGGQPQRGQRGALQRQRTSECIAGTVERDHEAVALALLDRTYRVVIGDESGEGAIELDDRRRRLLRLGFPQVGRSLDIGQQQRHRSGRQGAHTRLTPVRQGESPVRISRAQMATKPVVSIRYHAVMGMTLRTSAEQAEALRRQAAAEGRSMQAVALSAIDEYIARRTHKAKVAAALQRVVREEAEVLRRLKDA